ncbi:MAG: DsbA family protein [Rhodospirillales bacterium]
MRRLPVVLLATLAFAAFAAPPPAAQVRDRAEIERIVRDVIRENPEIVLEALEALRSREAKAREEQARRMLTERREDLLRDPASPVGGNPQGDVTIVEFFDYQCGYCKTVHGTVKDLLASDGRIRTVYTEFPILGPGSVLASRAALASRGQGKYLAFHDALMEARGAMNEETVLRIARSVGLDVDRLRRDMHAPEVERAIRANMALAEALGIQGTPAFVIGDQVVPGALELDGLRMLIRRARGS